MHATLEDLARAKGVHATYVSRVLRLTLLAPEIVEAILDGRQPAELQLDDLLEGFPLEWEGQRYAAAPALRGVILVDISTSRRWPRVIAEEDALMRRSVPFRPSPRSSA